MMDQQRRLSEPLRWTRAGRIAVAALAAGLVLGALAVGIYAATGGFSQPSQAGCIEVTFASTTGGARLHACGARARRICAAPESTGGVAGAVRDACRRAGYTSAAPARQP
jgi:hypothetical protein